MAGSVGKRLTSRRAALALTGLFALVATALLIAHLWASHQLRAAVHAAQAQGMLRLEDLLEQPRPDEPNASLALDAIDRLLDSQPELPQGLDLRTAKLDELLGRSEIVARAEHWLAIPEHRLSLEIIDLHAHTEHATSADNSTEVFIGWQTGEAQARSGSLRLAKLLQLRAGIALLDGRIADAFSDAALILRMADWMHRERPGIVPWLLGNATARIGTETLESLQQIASPPIAERQLLRAAIENLAARPPTWGLEGERAFNHRLYELARRDRLPVPFEHGEPRVGPLGAWLWDRFHARTLVASNELIRYAAMPAAERPGSEAFLKDDSPVSVLARILIPNLLDSITKTDIVRTRFDLARIALAWEDHKSARGTYPESSAGLVPKFLDELPRDTFSNTPLRWHRSPDECLLYSVGADGADQGGVDAGTPQGGDPDDVAWRLPCSTEEA